MLGAMRFVHLLGMAFWLGGMFTISLWVARARRSGDESIVSFVYSTASGLYRRLIATGAWLSIVSGVVLMFVTGRPWFRPFPEHWLFQMQVVGVIAFVLTVLIVLPNANALATLARKAVEEGGDLPEFKRRVKKQAIFGSVVGALLIYLVLLGGLRF